MATAGENRLGKEEMWPWTFLGVSVCVCRNEYGHSDGPTWEYLVSLVSGELRFDICNLNSIQKRKIFEGGQDVQNDYLYFYSFGAGD